MGEKSLLPGNLDLGAILIDDATTKTPYSKGNAIAARPARDFLRCLENRMSGLLVQWLLYAVALMVVSWVVPGFKVDGLWPALVAALVIGLLNATVGLFLKIVTFPLSILTLGIFLLVINGLMILLASSIVRGFNVRGFVPAFLGAAVLALLGMLIRSIVKGR